MLEYRKYLIFVLMLVFIISISAAGESANGNFNSDRVKNNIHPKIESGLLEENQGIGIESAFPAQYRDQSTKRVVFELKDSDKSHIRSLEDSGAVVEAVHEDLVQASVPVSQLQAMSDLPFVNYVRSPRIPFKDVISEGVGVINATPIHNLGVRGKGIKIAILDVGFADYQSKLGTELPVSGNVTVRSFRKDRDITGGDQNHGTAVAEIIYDIAPDAKLYLINFEYDVEFPDAVNYAVSENVDIISMSLGWLDGPFDGTSVISAKVNSAVSGGIVWVNSAGNYAQKHWQGKFIDTDNDTIHDFAPGDENMSIGSGGITEIFLSWDDCPASYQDYDLYVYNSTGYLSAFSATVQDGTQPPVERISSNLAPGTYNLQIRKYNATRDVNFELYSAYQDIESQYQVPSSSLSIPADAQGAITVGATYYLNDILEPFSSRGPTDDGRTKPDVVAPDGVKTSTLSPFYGTSASAPHAAGAAALLKSINSSLTPASLRSALQYTAKSLGDPNSYGSGRIDAWKAAVTVDKRPPVITIASPISGQILKTSIITVNGTASDNLGLNKVEIKVGTGTWKNASGTNSWSATITLSPGPNTILARATDAAGNTNETSITVTSDTVLPIIILESPANGQKLNTSTITVSGTASDDLGLDKVEVRVGAGAWKNASGTNSWSAIITLSAGLNTISARAIDSAGNIQNTSVNVTLDITAPTITITFPKESQKLNKSVITVTGTASDNDLSKVEIMVGNLAWQNASGTNSWNAIITLSPGLNTISARAIDNAGNIQNTSVNVTLDITAPTITIAFPKESQKLNESVITVMGTASDNDLSKVEIMVGTGTWQNASGTNSWSSTITLSPGPNTILARATDTAGNTNETSITVTLDTVLPIIILESPANGQKLNTSTITVSGTASDDLGLDKVEVRVKNGSWQTASGTTSWIISIKLLEGINTVYARAIDLAGNTQETSVNVTLDMKKPEVTNLRVSTSTPIVNNPVNIEAKVIDDYPENLSSFVLVEAPDGNRSNCPMVDNGMRIYKCKFENTSRYGRYNITIIASDLAGNVNDTEKTWFVTTTKPYENNSVNTVENNITEINALKEVNTTLELVTSMNVSKDIINITMKSDIPPEMNRSMGLVPFGKYISIYLGNDIVNSLIWMKLRIYYTESELITSGLDENSLRISYYNESSNRWESLSKGSPSWVNDAGVNSANINDYSGFVWANISHNSTFALVGSYPAPAQLNMQSSSPSGGGGGGGGGGASGENYSNIELREKYYLHIFKDMTTIYKFSNESNPIKFVNITGNINAGEVNTVVEVLRNTSSLVKIQPPGTVYKNVNIWVGTSGFAVPKNIKNAVIRFRAPNIWIESNGFASSEMKMVRWDGGNWVTLDTEVMEKDGVNTYFEVTTSAFSPFAATGIRSVRSDVFPENGSSRMNVLQPEPTGTTGVYAKGVAPPINFVLIIGVLILFILIITVLFLKRDGYLRR